MAEHPCAKGLTQACFKAHPKWARQAFAYKLMHLLLPKQATARLPKGLRQIFPNLPPGWDPSADAPGYLYPGYPEGWMYPEEGAGPPLYVGPWGPGPVHRPPGGIPGVVPTPSLLYEITDHSELFDFGDDSSRIYTATFHSTMYDAKVTELALWIGRTGDPIDDIIIRLRLMDGSAMPGDVIAGGSSAAVPASEIPYMGDLDHLTSFYFLNLPEILASDNHCFSIERSGAPDPDNFYRVGGISDIAGYTWNYPEGGPWQWGPSAYYCHQVWGYPI